MMKIKLTGSLVVALGLILGVGVLLASLTRATMEKVINDENLGQLRVVPVVVYGREIYKLPHGGKLPGESFYFLKKIRNWSWERFAKREKTKIELNLILADKKMSEAWALFKNEQRQEAVTAGDEAVNKLKYAYQLLMESKVDQESQEMLQEKIAEKEKVYKEILESWENQ